MHAVENIDMASVSVSASVFALLPEASTGNARGKPQLYYTQSSTGLGVKRLNCTKPSSASILQASPE